MPGIELIATILLAHHASNRATVAPKFQKQLLHKAGNVLTSPLKMI